MCFFILIYALNRRGLEDL
jgi:hypothetical protein